MGDKRAAASALVMVAGVLLVAVLVTWAASIGTSDVLTGEGPEAVRLTPSETSATATPEGEAEQQEGPREVAGGREVNPLLRTIAFVLEVLLALGVLYLLWRGGRSAWESFQARRRPGEEPEDLDFDVLDVPAARVVDEIARDADAQRELLLGGAPRNGIVGCWHRFEMQAADAGVSPRVWETSSEFTLRFLDLAGADPAAVARLAALYREARFSAHDVDEDARRRAVEAVDAIHRSLGGVTR